MSRLSAAPIVVAPISVPSGPGTTPGPKPLDGSIASGSRSISSCHRTSPDTMVSGLQPGTTTSVINDSPLGTLRGAPSHVSGAPVSSTYSIITTSPFATSGSTTPVGPCTIPLVRSVVNSGSGVSGIGRRATISPWRSPLSAIATMSFSSAYSTSPGPASGDWNEASAGSGPTSRTSPSQPMCEMDSCQWTIATPVSPTTKRGSIWSGLACG